MTRASFPAATAALLAVLAVAPAAQAAFPGRNGHIAYEFRSLMEPEEGGPSRSVYSLRVAELDGPERFTLRSCTRIADVPQDPACGGPYSDPAYSPRGDLLVVDAGPQLAIMASDGSDFHLLPRQTADDGEPAWSPDGNRIAFTGTSDPATTARDLYVLDMTKGTSRRLTTRGARMPAWSSRNRIAYVLRFSDTVGQPPRGQLAVIRPDGSGFRQLTRKGGVAPAWSPHARKLAFVRGLRLYVMDADGTDARRVGGRRPISADDVAWSPDGRRFAVHAFESGFFVMRTDGTGERTIATGGSGSDYAYDAFAPDWQPVGRGRLSPRS